MKSRVFIISLLIFCLVLANFVSVNTSSELEEDPLVPGWSKDVRISNASGDSLHPSIAVDSKGWIHIVWQDARTGDWKIYYARSRDGGETLEEKVVADQPSSDNTPSMIIDKNDVIHMVWSAFVSGEGTEIYYKNSTDGGNTWGEDARLTYASGESHVPRIATYENALYVVWSDKRDGNYEIYYKRSTDWGNSWDEDVRLTNDSGPSKLPSVAVDLTGNLHVAWADERGDVVKIYYRTSTYKGVIWDDEVNVSEGHGAKFGTGMRPNLMVDSHNNLHVIWQDGAYGNEKIYYRKRIANNNAWELEKEIATATRGGVPSAVIDPEDNLHVVWWDMGVEFYYKRSELSVSGWGDDIPLTSGGLSLQLTIDYTNILHLAYVTTRDGNKEIYYKRTLNPVTEPPIVVTQTLNVSTCKPGNSVTVSGNAKWNNTPAINASVCVKIIEIGALWTTTTDSNGDYNITITAPSTPGNYTIRTTVSFDNRIGTKYAKLTVESEGVVDGGVTNGRQQEGLNIIYLAIIGAVAGGIIVAFALLRMRKTKVPKVEKPKEEQKLDIEFPSKIQTMTLRCPECRMTFSIEVKPKPFGVKCPNCGREGEIK